ncbi:HPP family protein [Thalassomonas actiniarum]|uniref:HPP family protein n=1 Tax=Thalassomonas actiniarum TaxID=485447 RepID=A0AAF0C6H2_9GAMM|nr:HPP family protein [Thalassomonas actiniarum]WDE02266.1 HPP family protein [Thalassomonas actiniarum]
MKTKLPAWWKTLGIQDATAAREQLLLALGGFLSIFIVFLISYKVTGLKGAGAILPSMGAAIVLLMAAPKAIFSRPWALFTGNVLSAVVGVCCYQWIGDNFIAAGSAVGLAMLVMFASRCLHPPGGATALAAVVGGDVIHELGFYYVLTPTLLNCLILFLVSYSVNQLIDKRHYPKQTQTSGTS